MSTNDSKKISRFAKELAERGIHAVVLDTDTNTLEEHLGKLPFRLMVDDEDFEVAKALFILPEQDIASDETFDRLLDGRVLLRQSREGYRVAIDPVLLAASIDVKPKDRVLDVGSGVGAAALCLSSRCTDAEIYGLELQPELVARSRLNATDSGLKIKFFQGNLLSPPPTILAGGFAHVIANPPYLPPERADPRTSWAKAKSHIEGDARLLHWVDFMVRMASPNGTVTLVHRSDRLDEILALLHGHAGGIVVFPIWPRLGVSPKRVIIRAKVGSSAPLRISPGIVLHKADGQYTEMALSVLSDASSLVI